MKPQSTFVRFWKGLGIWVLGWFVTSIALGIFLAFAGATAEQESAGASVGSLIAATAVTMAWHFKTKAKPESVSNN